MTPEQHAVQAEALATDAAQIHDDVRSGIKAGHLNAESAALYVAEMQAVVTLAQVHATLSLRGQGTKVIVPPQEYAGKPGLPLPDCGGAIRGPGPRYVPRNERDDDPLGERS